MQQAPANKHMATSGWWGWRLIRSALFTCMAVLPWQSGVAVADVLQSEYRIKAAFLYNFARFTSWPGHDDPEFTLCILGESPFNGELDALAGKHVHDRPLRISYSTSANETGHCQIIFISESYRQQLDTAIETLRSQAILSVSDIDDFINHGGIIGLRTIDNKVRFEINIEAAAGAGLSISSRLLSLSTTIRSGR